MVEYDPADVERRVRAGEWMTTTAVATLFNRDRTTVYRWTKRRLLNSRKSPGGGEILCDPGDVVRMLDKYRRGTREEQPAPEQGAPEQGDSMGRGERDGPA